MDTGTMHARETAEETYRFVHRGYLAKVHIPIDYSSQHVEKGE